MKKDNQYHWTQTEASSSQYNWQQPLESNRMLATLKFLGNHGENGIELWLLPVDVTEPIKVPHIFSDGGFDENGAGLYLVQNHRDASIVTEQIFNLVVADREAKS